MRIFTSLSNITSMKPGYPNGCGENPLRSRKNAEFLKIQIHNLDNKEKSYAYISSGR
jgi:hypothetical protein